MPDPMEKKKKKQICMNLYMNIFEMYMNPKGFYLKQ